MVAPNEKLEAARMCKRWSIAVASEKAGVSVNTFNRWERGLQVPQLGTLDQLCKAFDLTPEELGFAHAICVKRRADGGYGRPLPLVREPVTLVSGAACQTSALSLAPLPALQPLLEHDHLATITCPQQQVLELETCIEQAKRSLESMNLANSKKDGDEGVSRRQAIAALIGTPAAIFGLSQGVSGKLLHPEEVLSLCAVNIPLSWQLYFEGGLAEVEHLLHGYLFRLTELAQQMSPYQRRAARMASQGHQLASLIALQHQNFGTAYEYANQAFTYGEQAGDPNLQTTSLTRQAQVYLYLKRPRLRLQAYEKALHYVDQTSPLLQGRVYLGLAEAYSSVGLEHEALQYLERAHATFPKEYSADPNYSYTHFNHWSLSALQGLIYLNLRQPTQAWQSFSHVDKTISTALVPNRIELTVRQAEAACALGDRDLSCAYLEKAATFSTQAGNQLRFDESYNIYEAMQARWENEPQVKMLAELFR